jgi:hypothetical protein
VAQPIYFLFLLLVLVLGSPAYARSSPTAEDDSCAILNVRTDVRPDADGPPTEIAVGIRMIDLMEISDVRQMLTGDLAVVLSWTDPRLAHLAGCEISLDDIWSPGLVFSNSGRRFLDRPRETGIGPSGQVRYVQRYSGTFATYHNLRDFPFDKQTFRVSLFSLEWSEKDVQLVVDEKVTGRREQLNISNWIVESVEGTINRDYFDATDDFHSRYDYLISGHRVTGYYLWKIILPLCLIVAMSWCVFWVNPAQHGPQIGLSATSMLTLIAFIFATTNMVPELGYLTLLDRFIVGSTVLVFLALLECLTTINLVSNEKRELATRIDRLSRLVFPIAFAIIIISVFIL